MVSKSCMSKKKKKHGSLLTELDPIDVIASIVAVVVVVVLSRKHQRAF